MFTTRRLVFIPSGLVVLAGGTAFLAVELSTSSTDARWLVWIIFGLISISSVMWIMIIRRRLGAAIQRIRTQLQHFEEADRIGMIMVDANDELGGLVSEINKYLTNIKFRFEKDHLEQKELQLQTRAAETETRQAEAVLLSISEAVIVTDRYDELLTANQAAQDIYDFSLELNYRLPIEQVIQEKFLLQLIYQARKDKRKNITRHIQRAHPESGKKLDLKVVSSCVLDDRKQVVGVVTVINDITAEKEIVRMKDDFVNSVSHELKTPLATIKAYSEMLADNEADSIEAQRQFCVIIQEQTDRLNRLIDEILNSSRIESGLLRASFEALDLKTIIDEVIATVEPQAREKNIEIEFCPTSEHLTIWADHEMIYQALLNLLGNALKYSGSQTKVSVRIRQDDNSQTIIEVEDRGVGIPEDCLEHIFDKFYRVPQNNHYAGGTGLGLYLTREIFQTYHNGRITVKSKPGRGSTFTVTLPVGKGSKLKTEATVSG